MLELTAALTAYFILLAAVLGLVMGSFLNCFAYRYSNNESVIRGRSKCALCGHALGSRDLVPVFSWLFLKGRCRFCGEKISPRYVAAELVCAALYVSVLLRFGLGVPALKYLVFVTLLFTAASADLYCGLIPDRLVIIGIITALAAVFFAPEGAVSALISTAIGGFSIALPLLICVLVFDRVKKRETMGGGDIKLMFMIGLFFDWKLNVLIIILACILGIVFAVFRQKNSSGGERAFPFAPALCSAAWLVMLFGEGLLGWYLRLFSL